MFLQRSTFILNKLRKTNEIKKFFFYFLAEKECKFMSHNITQKICTFDVYIQLKKNMDFKTILKNALKIIMSQKIV